jgi:hypothetical protein
MEPLSGKLLEQIRRRYDEFSPSGGSGYRNFYHAAHDDMGKLLDEIDRLARAEKPKGGDVELIPCGQLIEWNNRLWRVLEETVVEAAGEDEKFAYG